MIPAVPLTLGVLFCPESPRWYMKKGQILKAWHSMRKLRRTELQAARDLFYAYAQYAEEQKVVQGRNYFTRLIELFTIPRCRRATLAGSVVMIAQQMCGINIMAFVRTPVSTRMTKLMTAVLVDHLQGGRLQRHAGSVRLHRIRCSQLRLRSAVCLPHRLLRTPFAPALHFPEHVLDAPRRRSLFPDRQG